MTAITDKAMQAKPSAKDQWLIEDGARGEGRLVGRITPAGARSFYYRYTASGGERVRFLIGAYEPRGDGSATYTVQQARDKAREFAGLYRSGVKDLREHFAQVEIDRLQAEALERQRVADEQHQREVAAQAAALAQARRLTVRQVFDRWRATDLQPVIRGDGKRDGRKDGGQFVFEQFTRHVFPLIGEMALEDVRKADILAVIDAQKAKGQMRTAQQLLGDLKQMLAFALDRELIGIDPLATVKKSRVVGTPVMRDRALSEEEIGLLPQAIGQARMHPRSESAIWLILATGVRIGELMGAVWASDLPTEPKVRTKRLKALQAVADAEAVKLGIVDTQARTWHLPTTKNKRSHTIHLSDFALEQIRLLLQHREVLIDPMAKLGELSPWLFPATDNGRPVCVKSFGKQLADRQRDPEQRMSGRAKATTSLLLPGGKWTAHDLRRTAATVMAALGFSGDVIDECLNHVIESRARRTYIQDRREAEQLRAFDALGQRLQERKVAGSSVVPFGAV